MKVLAFGTVGLAAVILAAGCSSSAGPMIGQQSQAVQGGSVDTTHDYAVGVCAGNGPGECQLICSGALIAPNLVMTARHCVDTTPKQIDCTSSSNVFGAPYASASNYYITTWYLMNQGSIQWFQASQIITTPGGEGTQICGNDMAFLLLSSNVPIADAGGSFVTPVVQYSMSDHTRYSTTVTAIGYGDTDAVTMDAGERHILENVNLVCIPNDPDIPCGVQSQITNNEFVSGNSTCEGDSGSSAYEQTNFNKNIPVSFGVLSRGSTSGDTCEEPIYTRTDAWSSFIVSTALTAATAGGYTPPPWTQPPPPADAGTSTDSGGTAPDGAALPPPGTLGAPCGDNTDCTSGICESDDGGQTYICTQQCDPANNGSDCGAAGYQCVTAGSTDAGPFGYCFPAPPGTTSDPTQTGGCAVGRSDPSKPVPWKTLAFAGAYLATVLLRSRRRRSEQR